MHTIFVVCLWTLPGEVIFSRLGSSVWLPVCPSANNITQKCSWQLENDTLTEYQAIFVIRRLAYEYHNSGFHMIIIINVWYSKLLCNTIIQPYVVRLSTFIITPHYSIRAPRPLALASWMIIPRREPFDMARFATAIYYILRLNPKIIAV